jgi:general secretion pathway protein I
VRRAHGFTLIEVLVALAIAAIGLAAALSVVSESARNASYLHDKAFGSWIALNRLAEVRTAGILPSVDKTDGDVEFANGKWKWQQLVTETGVPGMRRVDITVRHDTDPVDATVASITGFVGRTQESAAASPVSWDYATGTAAAGATPVTPTAPPATTTADPGAGDTGTSAGPGTPSPTDAPPPPADAAAPQGANP